MSSYDAFAPLYDEWAAHMTEDVSFYVELAREADGPLVELGVGNGRVAIPVAREALYGWFDRRPFDERSEEFVFVARRPLG